MVGKRNVIRIPRPISHGSTLHSGTEVSLRTIHLDIVYLLSNLQFKTREICKENIDV